METSQPGIVMCTERLEVVHSSLLPAVPLLYGLSYSPASVITWKISIIPGTQLDGMAWLSFIAKLIFPTNWVSLAYVISLYDNFFLAEILFRSITLIHSEQ